MARAQQQGVGAVTIWMIVFVALWLASTVFLVLLYTGQDELRGENTRLLAAKNRLATNAEERDIELVRGAVDGGPTAVGLLEQARSKTAQLATGGDGEDDVATVRTKRDELLSTIRRDGLVDNPDDFMDIALNEALTLLYGAFTQENSRRGVAEDRVAELEAEVDDLVEINGAQQNDFQKRQKELSGQLAEAEESRRQYREDRDQSVARLEKEFDSRRAQSDSELTGERRELAQANRRLAKMQERFTAQQEKFGELMVGPEELATARREDGRILAAVPGDDIVYIDLGTKDRMLLGLQFAVYSAGTGIPADGQAKGQIEVVSISDSSAECKIVRVSVNEVILTGDLIANPIYDPSRALSFLVIGDFDLNGDRVPDPHGAETIESIIADWGGVIVTELTALTDFVVVGAAPRKPMKVSDTSEATRRVESMKRLRSTYMETVDGAKSLSVPVMTQEVFLRFLGY